MIFRILDKDCQTEVAALFATVFSASEGQEEGIRIADLALALAARTGGHDVICIGALEGGAIIGAIFFTTLRFDEPINAYLLSPVAISTAQQGKGLGQKLIGFGFEELRNRSVTLVVTYGDPAFYSKVGFSLVSEDVIQAPQPLSMPHGWLGIPLSGDSYPPLKSRPKCVPEFDSAEYW